MPPGLVGRTNYPVAQPEFNDGVTHSWRDGRYAHSLMVRTTSPTRACTVRSLSSGVEGPPASSGLVRLTVADEALMFNEDASILDHRQTGPQGPFAGEFVHHSKLHPDRFRPVGNRFLDDGRYFVRLPKDVHNIDLARDLTERGNCSRGSVDLLE